MQFVQVILLCHKEETYEDLFNSYHKSKAAVSLRKCFLYFSIWWSKPVKKMLVNYHTLHQGIEDENLFTFYEIWKSKAGLDTHNEQPYIKSIWPIGKRKNYRKHLVFLTTLI